MEDNVYGDKFDSARRRANKKKKTSRNNDKMRVSSLVRKNSSVRDYLDDDNEDAWDLLDD